MTTTREKFRTRRAARRLSAFYRGAKWRPEDVRRMQSAEPRPVLDINRIAPLIRLFELNEADKKAAQELMDLMIWGRSAVLKATTVNT